MTYPVIEPRDEQSSESAGRVVGTFFAFVFLIGAALHSAVFAEGLPGVYQLCLPGMAKLPRRR